MVDPVSTPTDPAFAGERIELSNGWSIRKCCSKGWVFFEPNGIDAVDHLPDEIARAFAASFSASAGVPEGYKLVPVEPTQEMLAVQVSPALVVGYAGNSRVQKWRAAVYAAMLAASPRVALPTAQGVPDELRALSEKAPPGPWEYSGAYDGCIFGGNPWQTNYGQVLWPIAYMSAGCPGPSPRASHETAKFIVDAVNYVRDLIARAAVSSSTAPGREGK